jgi:hypothetical protein
VSAGRRAWQGLLAVAVGRPSSLLPTGEALKPVVAAGSATAQ